MSRAWLVGGVLVAVGCAPAPGGDDQDGSTGGPTSAGTTFSSSTTGGGSYSSSGASSNSSTTSPTTATSDDTLDPTQGEATTDYPTHVSCEETSAGYDIPGNGDSGDAGESGGGDDTFDGMGDDIPIGATVFEVRQGVVPAGSWVEVADLVITSPPGERPEGRPIVFAQAPEGGMWSGITIVLSEGGNVPAMGDRVTVTGLLGERYVFSAIFVDDDGIVVEGTGAMPTPALLSPAELAPGAPAAEAYESALVRVEHPTVEEPESCVGEFTLDVGVGVDDLFLGDAAPNPAAGDEFSAVSGPLRYTFNGFEIAPRTAADVEP